MSDFRRCQCQGRWIIIQQRALWGLKTMLLYFCIFHLLSFSHLFPLKNACFDFSLHRARSTPVMTRFTSNLQKGELDCDEKQIDCHMQQIIFKKNNSEDNYSTCHMQQIIFKKIIPRTIIQHATCNRWFWERKNLGKVIQTLRCLQVPRGQSGPLLPVGGVQVQFKTSSSTSFEFLKIDI